MLTLRHLACVKELLNLRWPFLPGLRLLLLCPIQLMPLQIGDTAPDFDLPAVQGDRQFRIKLSDYRGKQNVVLSFHPLDWTPT